MKIAAFQFKGSPNIDDNFQAIKRGVIQASEQNVKVLITQECALCGYPPIEVESVNSIDFHCLQRTTEKIAQLAIQYQIYIGLGTIIPEKGSLTDSIILLFPDQEKRILYHKRALWGWDRDNFVSGCEQGIHTIDHIRLGFRICYEVRFPEYFRELFRENVEIACVSFCDVSRDPNIARYELIKSHLMTRAVENAMYVLSVNSTSGFQTAPTCLIDPDGAILKIAPPEEEYLMTFELEKPKSNIGRDGRIFYSRKLLGIH